MAKLINGANYFNPISLNIACEELEKGQTIEMYIDVIGHTMNNIVQEEYAEALTDKYGSRLSIDKNQSSYSHSYTYFLK